ncbi:MAG: ABC transporter ATP-binding protein/permease [Clostridiales bacterium]|nr:ABC transporter ATP-binding protein/permease [Clostridiales bacterium]MDD7035342.1 ABC transporter ATP-binding protein [Bacillota bacterium]
MKTTVKYYKKYIPLIALVVVLVCGQALGELALPKLMSGIIDNGIVASDMAYIRKAGLIMIAVAAATLIFSVSGGVVASVTAARTARDLRHDLFRKVTGFAAAEFDSFSTASLITRTTNDIQMIQQATVMMLRMLLFAPIMGAGAVYMALKTSVSLSWTIVLALICVLGLMVFCFIVVFPRFKVMQEKLDRINLIMKERLSGTMVIRAFTTEKYEEDRFDYANKDLTKLYIFVNKAMSFMMPTMTFIMSGVGILIIWAGAHLVDTGSLMVGDMLAYLQYAMHVIMSFMFVTMIFVMIPRAAVSARRVGEVLDREYSIEDPADSKDEAPGKGSVEFRNVTFAYSDTGEPAVEDISFTAEPGKTTAIIGGTGSGKSTLVNLIDRFYDVSSGSVLVDGTDVREMTQKDLRSRIGLVPQKATLFSGTIESNLRYGNEDATAEELAEAAEIAQAMDFIESKPEGMQEEISQGGTNVSGGQKQRLCIARALVKKPEILVFDDSFSALDFTTDKALRKALDEKAADCTRIIVAQRINTILNADRIIVLDEGHMAGCGTHEELMRDCRVYREIALSQLSEEEIERGNA